MASYCKCMFDYEACDSDELGLSEGNIVEITDDSEEGWWHGKCKGKVGMFPSNFVERISVAEAHAALGIATPAPQPVRKTTAAAARRPAPETARADFSYDAQDDDEISFAEKDVVQILDKNPGTEGWWKVSLNGKTGLVPDNFFRIITRGEEPASVLAPKTDPSPAPSVSTSARNSMSEERPPAPVPATAGRPMPGMGSAVVAGLAGLRRTSKPGATPGVGSGEGGGGAPPKPAKAEQPPAPVVQDWRANLKKRPPGKQLTTDDTPKDAKEPEDTKPQPSWMKKRTASLVQEPPQSATGRKDAPTPDAEPVIDAPKATPDEAKPVPSWMKKKPAAQKEPAAEMAKVQVPKVVETEPASTSAAADKTAAPWKKREDALPDKPAPGSVNRIKQQSPASLRGSESASSISTSARPSIDRTAGESCSSDVRALQESISTLLSRVGTLELKVTALQKNVGDLEDDVVAEKKLRSACEVELQSIRKKLRD